MKTIAISLSPNAQRDDIWLAFRQLLTPWKWNSDKPTVLFEKMFSDMFGNNYGAVAVNSGRSAEYLIFKTLGVGVGDEIVVQAFTCVAVPNSVLWTGSKPIYCDVNDEYNIDPKDLARKLSKKTRAIVVQHTFGVPANMNMIIKVVRNAEKKFGTKITIIEDCAHSLGATYNGKNIGTLGDIAFFSFGRDKVISSVFGGMVLAKDEMLRDIKVACDSLKYPSHLWTLQQVIHPIAFSIILPTYKIGFGKITIGKTILFLLQKLKFLSKPVYAMELTCGQPKVFPMKMPGVLSKLALNQYRKLNIYNKHRVDIANYYHEKLQTDQIKLPNTNRGAIWLRYPIKIQNALGLIAYAKKHGVLLGNWYTSIIDPKSDMQKLGYIKGSCPKAEMLAKETINLPTYPNLTTKQANMVVQLIKQWLDLN